jgi:glycerol-3-phosphate O-acyltransferase
VEHIEHVRAATAAGRVVYISNHKSHLDYLLELLALEISRSGRR